MARSLRCALAFAAALWLLCLPATGSAQVRKQFGEWVAVCQPDAAGYCSANARIRAHGEGQADQPYAFQLQVWRARAGEPLQVTFLAGARQPGEGQALQARVDGGQPLTLEAGTGYRSVRAGNAYALQDQRALAALLSEMRRGKRLVLTFRDTRGQASAVAFPLNGYRQAVGSFERAPPVEAAAPQRHEAQRQTRPEAAPAAMPEDELAPPVREPRRKPSVVTESAPAMQADQPAAAARGGPPSRKARRESLRQFTCRGNEPAWSLVLDRQGAELQLPDADPPARELTGKFSISGEGRTPVMTWKGRASGERRDLVAVIAEQACRDSMSDGEGQTAFAFQAQVTLPDGRKVRGCCNAGLLAPSVPAPSVSAPSDSATAVPPPGLESASVADFAMKAPDDWARLLPDLQLAVDICLAKTPGGSAYVTKAWPMSRGVVGVRTRGGEGTWFNCIAHADGGAIERMDALQRGEPPLPGENLTLFTPAGGTPRSGNCWQHERVLDAAGRLIGYLSYNTC